MSQEQSKGPANRHAMTAVERQRLQLAKLLKDPTKSAFIPPPPKEKTIRPPREMMKNVQGSSAGAGSGEFHVYKAGRRREYERLKLLDETVQKEADQAEFERKMREVREATETKTAKNRAKRLKKKERAKGKGTAGEQGPDVSESATDLPMKKRRLINGREVIFKKVDHVSEDEDEDEDEDESGQDVNDGDQTELPSNPVASGDFSGQVKVLHEPSRVVIHED